MTAISRHCLTAVLTALLFALLASRPALAQAPAARTINVPGDYPTIAQALTAAASGDTVKLQSGTYHEGELQVPAGVTLLGSGWQSTTVDGGGSGSVIRAGQNSRIEGLTVRGSSAGYFDAGIWTQQDAVTISHSRLTANNAGVWAWCFDPTCKLQVTVEYTIVDLNTTNGLNGNPDGVFVLRNDTITRNGGAGVILNNAASTVDNTIIAANTGDGLLNNAAARVCCSDVWGNARDYVGGSIGPAGISSDPLFRNPANGDYSLSAGSPAIGAGLPSDADMGALPFTPVNEPPATVTLAKLAGAAWLVTWPDTGAASYVVYYGPCSRQRTTAVPVSGRFSYQIDGVTAEEVGYVAVSSVDANGSESFVRTISGAAAPCPSTPTSLAAGAFPSGLMRLEWQDTSSAEDGYQVERATGILSTTEHGPFVQIATLPPNTTVYTDTPPSLEQTYWYRVRAYNGNGLSVYSNATYNATFAAVPNLDEQYLLVLINQARSDPGAFGYPDIAPVPPLVYNPLLNYAAHSHSQAILNSAFQIGHCDDVSGCPTERAHAVGYIGGVSENLIAGETGPQSTRYAHQAFMDSAGHRANLLCACSTEAGLGHTYDPDKGGASFFKGQYTETFGGEKVPIPNLPSGIAIPYGGSGNPGVTAYTFLVNYYNAAGSPPTSALVIIDGVPHTMQLATGAAANGTYTFTLPLTGPDHTYSFSFTFAGGSAQLPASGSYTIGQPQAMPLTHLYLPRLIRGGS